MGLADVVELLQEPYSSVYGPESLLEASRKELNLLKLVKQKSQEQGFIEGNIKTEAYVNLRYQGTDTAIMVKSPANENGLKGDYAFVKLFQREYRFICDGKVCGIGFTIILKPLALEAAKEFAFSPGGGGWGSS